MGEEGFSSSYLTGCGRWGFYGTLLDVSVNGWRDYIRLIDLVSAWLRMFCQSELFTKSSIVNNGKCQKF